MASEQWQGQLMDEKKDLLTRMERGEGDFIIHTDKFDPSRPDQNVDIKAAIRRTQRRRRCLHFFFVFMPLLFLTFKAWTVYRPSNWCVLIDPDHIQKAEVYNSAAPPFGQKECTRPRRSYEQHESFRSITGNFDLYDDLSLTTATGSINAVVYLQAGCGPQTLRVNAQTGSVNVRMVIEDGTSIDVVNKLTPSNEAGNKNNPDKDKDDDEFPGHRPINTFISTKTGSISAALIHGNGGTMKLTTVTGSLDGIITLHGVGPHDPIAHMYTSTSTGHQHITINRGTSQREPVVQLSALHESTSTGWIHLDYPHEWMGKLWARTVGTGSVNVDGEGLRYVKGSENEVLAYRGNTTYAQEVVAKSFGTGSIKFHC